jgi:type II secretory pathway pseudopilin PulG
MEKEHDAGLIDKNELERIRKAATLLLDKAEALTLPDLTSTIQLAANVLKLPLEIDQSQEELKKLEHDNRTAGSRDRHERFGAFVALLTPLISVIALAATLAFQTWQYRQAETARKEAAEEAAWTRALDILSKSNQASPEVIAIQPFLQSKKHGDEAKKAVIREIVNNTDITVFDDLFNGVFTPMDWSNLDELLALDRALYLRAGPIYEKAWDYAKNENAPYRLSESERRTYDYATYVLPKLCEAVGSVLRTERPPGRGLDLSGTRFQYCDWSRVSLRGANLSNIDLGGVNLEDADLGNIAGFGNSAFQNLAWWKASNLSPELVTYLREKWACNPHEQYWFGSNGPVYFSEQQCAEFNGKFSDTAK